VIEAEPAARAIPGERLLHPLSLAAVALLVLNDHLLKARFPGWWTGKLSDFAGLAFFPVFLQALWEWSSWALRRFRGPSRRALLGAILATALGFSLAKTWEPAAAAYREVWGVLAWPLQAGRALVSGRALPGRTRVRAVADPTDLLALPSLGVAWWIGSRRTGRSPSRPQ